MQTAFRSEQEPVLVWVYSCGPSGRTYPGVRSSKRPGYFYSVCMGCVSIGRFILSYLSILFASIHLYTWVNRGTMRVKCLAQKTKRSAPAGVQPGTRIAQSRDQCVYHQATALLSNSHIPVAQSVPVNPVGHKHWKVVGVRDRQVALFGHGLDEQRFCV